MSHLDEAAKKLIEIRQKCVENYFTNLDHFGYLMECLIMQIAGLRDAIENKNTQFEIEGSSSAT